MGTMISLALGRLEVDWGKNNFFTDHRALFQKLDLKPVPSYYAGENWPDGDPIVEMNVKRRQVGSILGPLFPFHGEAVSS